MQLNQFTGRALVCLLSLFFFSGPAFATGYGSISVTLSNTPTPLNCTGVDQYVSAFSISTVPAGSGKVYVGTPSLSRSTLQGAIAILYPNSGQQSETYSHTGVYTDSINLCSILVAGDVAGDTIKVSYQDIYGVSGAGKSLVAVAGPSATTSWTTTNGLVTFHWLDSIRAQVIPGSVGKIKVGYGSGYSKELYPNTGNTAQHNAWSEFFQFEADNTVYDGLISVAPEVVTESALISGWVNTYNGTYNDGAGPNPITRNDNVLLNVTTTATALPQITSGTTTTAYGSNLSISTIPGYCSKVYIGTMLSGIFAPVKILYPNCSGGWSESFDYPASIALTTLYIKADYAVSVYYSAIPQTSGRPLLSLNPTWSVAGQAVPLNVGVVNSLKVSVIPGQTGKVYVGTATMNRATGAGVLAILYPNSVGRWSEEYDLSDDFLSIGRDSIDTSSLYVTGDVATEGVTVAAYQSGSAAPSPFVLRMSGAISASGTTLTPISGTSLGVTALRAQVIPGNVGKVHIDNYKVLWPNTGNYNVGEGFSETFTLGCFSTVNGTQMPDNCLNLNTLKWYPEVSGEKLIVSAWGH